MSFWFRILLLVAWVPPIAAKPGDAVERPAIANPNVVVIFIDDMGYGDIGPFGSTRNQTPHLDRMAREGRTLTSFYVAAPVCTPSRAALMTGCYPKRVGLATGSGHIVLFPGDPHGLHPEEWTMAEMFKSAGYATGCFGKWHLGDQAKFLPTAQGFDTYYGIPYSNDMWPPLKRFQCPDLPVMRDTKVVSLVKDMKEQGDLCRQFTEEAVKFIRTNKEKPFFVYLPHAFVHGPRAARAQFMKNAKDETEAQIEEVDWSVGEILKTLREEKLAEKTLVLFTSDNGGARGCVNLPLRGGKGSIFEGGMREPTVAWWPGKIPAGTTSDELMTTMDLLPTFAKMVGGTLSPTHVIDGKDIALLLFGQEGAKTPHEFFFFHQAERLGAVRSGSWKFHRAGQLYDLAQDIGEKKNVAADHSEVVARLGKAMDEFEAELGKGMRPVGVVKNSRTLVPRPGVKGEEGFRPTLSLKKK
jgi:arylsulfatase A